MIATDAARTKHLVFFVNGPPRSGKDTACDFLQQLFAERDVRTTAISSIDPVRDLLRTAGFDVNNKTLAMRALLSEVGASLEKYNGFRTKACIDHAVKFAQQDKTKRCVVLVHAREDTTIHAISTALGGVHQFFSVRVLITGGPQTEQATSNASDADVLKMSYDVRIDNTGTLDDLYGKLDSMVTTLAGRRPPRREPTTLPTYPEHVWVIPRGNERLAHELHEKIIKLVGSQSWDNAKLSARLDMITFCLDEVFAGYDRNTREDLSNAIKRAYGVEPD